MTNTINPPHSKRRYLITRCPAKQLSTFVDEPPRPYEEATARCAELEAADPDNEGRTSSWGKTLYFPQLLTRDLVQGLPEERYLERSAS